MLDVTNGFREVMATPQKSLHDAGWDRPHDSGSEEEKRTEI